MYQTPIASRLSQRFADISAQSVSQPQSTTRTSVTTDPNGDRRTVFTSTSGSADDVRTTTNREVVSARDDRLDRTATPPRLRWDATATSTVELKESRHRSPARGAIPPVSPPSQQVPYVGPGRTQVEEQGPPLFRQQPFGQEAPLAQQQRPPPQAQRYPSTSVPPVSPRPLACPRGHSLTLFTSSTWECDVCRTHGADHTSMACRLCDFDICSPCAASTMGIPPVMSPEPVWIPPTATATKSLSPDVVEWGAASVIPIATVKGWACAQNVPGLYESTDTHPRSVSPEVEVVSVSMQRSPPRTASVPTTAQRTQSPRAVRGVSFGENVTAVVDTEGKQPGENRFAPNMSYSPVSYLTRERLQELQQRQRPMPIQTAHPPESIVGGDGASMVSVSPQIARVCRDLVGAFLQGKGCHDTAPDVFLDDATFMMDLFACVTGVTMVRYSSTGTPHERFVYLELYPCEVTKQVLPHLSYAVHGGAAHAQGRIPLHTLANVSVGPNANAFRRHMPNRAVVLGPILGDNKRFSYHACYCFSANFVHDKEVAFLAPNAMVFHSWTTVLQKFLTMGQTVVPAEGEFQFEQHL